MAGASPSPSCPPAPDEHAASARHPASSAGRTLLDLKLPRLDGLQVLERVKGDPALRTLPVVMLTSSSQEADLSRSYGAGVNAYVVKPVGFSEFVLALRELGLFWAVVNHPPPVGRAAAT